MELNEFLGRESEEVSSPEELDVQKAVVESLAADKAELDEHIISLQRDNDDLKAENAKLKTEISNLNAKIEQMKDSLEKVGDVLANNADGITSNKVSLLDRDPELTDRFPGETRDQVLEVISAARAQAEQEGRLRKAQLLESVLVANEPLGDLAKKRVALKKFFNDNGNILSGPVIEKLEKYGIQYKNGEEFLLPDEIMKRIY